jgi:DNA-binding FadR family transcriptional regulator
MAADNTVLYQLYEKLTDIFDESRADGLQSMERNRRSVETHFKILTAIENRDPNNALKNMKRHMHQVEKSMKNMGKLSFNTGVNVGRAKRNKQHK